MYFNLPRIIFEVQVPFNFDFLLLLIKFSL